MKKLKVSVYFIERINKMLKAERKFKETNKRTPTNEELATLLDEKLQDVVDMKELLKKTEIKKNEYHHPYACYVSNNEICIKDNNEYEKLKLTIKNNIDVLNEREQKIIGRRFGLIDGYNYTIEQLMDEFDLSRERVKQILVKSIRKVMRLVNKKRMTT